jgi:hypothetical protein
MGVFGFAKVSIEFKGSVPILNCPICSSDNTRKDFDFPDSMRCCDSCGCDYIAEDGEIILDPREIK